LQSAVGNVAVTADLVANYPDCRLRFSRFVGNRAVGPLELPQESALIAECFNRHSVVGRDSREPDYRLPIGNRSLIGNRNNRQSGNRAIGKSCSLIPHSHQGVMASVVACVHVSYLVLLFCELRLCCCCRCLLAYMKISIALLSVHAAVVFDSGADAARRAAALVPGYGPLTTFAVCSRDILSDYRPIGDCPLPIDWQSGNRQSSSRAPQASSSLCPDCRMFDRSVFN
jgi:hypothetical protein